MRRFQTILRNGFSLVEVTVAMGIAAFTLVAIFGLLPVGMSSSEAAIHQTLATGLITSVLEDLRSTQSGAVESDLYKIPLPTDSTVPPSTPFVRFVNEAGGVSAVSGPDSVFLMRITFVAAQHAAAPAQAILEVIWPAAADPLTAKGKVKIFSAIQLR